MILLSLVLPTCGFGSPGFLHPQKKLSHQTADVTAHPFWFSGCKLQWRSNRRVESDVELPSLIHLYNFTFQQEEEEVL